MEYCKLDLSIEAYAISMLQRNHQKRAREKVRLENYTSAFPLIITDYRDRDGELVDRRYRQMIGESGKRI